MSAAEIRRHLLDLACERLEAERLGIAANHAYVADLEAEITVYRAALAGAAVTEIAVLRGELFGRNYG